MSLFLFPDCICCDTCFECSNDGNFTGMADEYEVIVSGITAGGDHSSCTNANGTFTLSKTSAGSCTSPNSHTCCYESTQFTHPDPGDCVNDTFTDVRWTLSYSGDWIVGLLSDEGDPVTNFRTVLATYKVACEDFDPLGDNTANIFGVNCCSTWPSTIEVNAIVT